MFNKKMFHAQNCSKVKILAVLGRAIKVATFEQLY